MELDNLFLLRSLVQIKYLKSVLQWQLPMPIQSSGSSVLKGVQVWQRKKCNNHRAMCYIAEEWHVQTLKASKQKPRFAFGEEIVWVGFSKKLCFYREGEFHVIKHLIFEPSVAADV